MGKKEILEYVFTTPDNTNPAVLSSMLDSFASEVKYLADLNVTKVEDYLYEIEYDDYKYEDASGYFEAMMAKPGLSTISPACSSIRKDNLYGRNLDWYYDKNAEFIIRVGAKPGRHASIGVAKGAPIMTNKFVESGAYDNSYKALPYLTEDGINDAGVICNVNVTSNEHGITSGTTPGAPSMCILGLIRFILDNADSAKDIIPAIRALDLYAIKDEELHVMIADATDTFILEFCYNTLVVLGTDEEVADYPLPNDIGIMTNFNEVEWDGSTATGMNMYGETKVTNGPMHGCGYERYHILQEKYNDINTVEDMRQAMKDVKYSNAFYFDRDLKWYSEFYGDMNGIDFNKETTELTEPMERFLQATHDFVDNIFLTENRDDGQSWHTTHCSVYDMDKKEVHIYPQETPYYEPNEYIYSL